jgi:DNA-binding CsgD family transcriptional regulator
VYAFRHDLVHEAVLHTLPAPAVRALERQAAGVLLKAGAAPTEIAIRMARSADTGDETAIDTLREASRALAPSDPRLAYELAQSALALLPHGDLREGGLMKEIVLLMHLAGDSDEANELAERARRVLGVAEQAELALTIATVYSIPDAVRLAANREALALEGVPDALRAIHAAILTVNLAASGFRAEARAADVEAERMVHDAGTAEAAAALAVSRVTLGAVEGDHDEVLRRIEAVDLRSDDPGQQTTQRAFEWNEANALAGLDRLDEAIALISEGVRTAHRDRQGWIASRWELYRGRHLVQAGRLADAKASTEWVFEQEMIEVPLTIAVDCGGLVALGRVALHTNDRELSRRCAAIARVTLEAGASLESRRHLALLLLLQALGRGDDVGIAEAFALVGEHRTESVLPLLGRENCDSAIAVRGALRIHALDIADQVIDQAQAWADANPDVRSLRASVAHARGLRHDDIAELRMAVRDLTGGPRPLALASALEDLGAQSARQGARDEAVHSLGRALELYAGCEATWDARRVRRRLRDLGVRRRLVAIDRPENGWAALTPTELDVARLLGQGLTNRAAAERLYVSPNTVGTHARNVFRKLGVRSRAELASLLATDAQSG